MIFRLIIDRDSEEEVRVTAHERSDLTDRIEEMVNGGEKAREITAYDEKSGIKKIGTDETECVLISGGKTYAVYKSGEVFRLKMKLCEAESILPPQFIRISKSALANKDRIERFKATIGGAVSAVFLSGYEEYVSRRCYAQIKRRLEGK